MFKEYIFNIVYKTSKIEKVTYTCLVLPLIHIRIHHLTHLTSSLWISPSYTWKGLYYAFYRESLVLQVSTIHCPSQRKQKPW